MTVRGVRGATTADENSRSAILNATSELLKEIVARNDISVDDIASVLFTTTADLNAEFPAAAALARLFVRFHRHLKSSRIKNSSKFVLFSQAS